MTSCHVIVLAVKIGSTLILDQAKNYQQVDLNIYQRLIGKLMYLSYGTCSNIAFIIKQLNCHNLDSQIK